MAVDPNIKKKADDIRNKIYGKEVRESLASGLEEMSSDVTETISRQMQLGSQWQDVIDETTNLDVVSAPEIIAARDGEANLKARLDKEKNQVTTQLAHKANKANPEFRTETSQYSTISEDILPTASINLGTGWSGSIAGGFTHSPGNTQPLVFNIPSLVESDVYQINVQIFKEDMTDTSGQSDYWITLGGSDEFETYRGRVESQTWGIINAGNNNQLVIRPFEDFDGRLTLTMRRIIEFAEPYISFLDENGSRVQDFRPSLLGVDSLYFGRNSGRRSLNTPNEQNTGLGSDALTYNTTGFWNTALGYRALATNSVGSRNVAIGRLALEKNETGDRNIAVGPFTLSRNTTGRNNIGIGADSLWYNTTGEHNIGIGLVALGGNTDGNNNIALGNHVMQGSKGGEHNFAVGNLALYYNEGRNNVALGFMSKYRNINGDHSIAIGSRSNYNGVDGRLNIALGFETLFENVSGVNNIAIGTDALKRNLGDLNIGLGVGTLANSTNANGNIAIGENALYHTAADNNIGIGSHSLYLHETGKDNIGLGELTLRNGTNKERNIAIGNNALNDIEGNQNVAIGVNAGFDYQTGTDNIFIGDASGARTDESGSNNILIGKGVSTSERGASNEINIGNAIKSKDSELIEMAKLMLTNLSTTQPSTTGTVWNDGGTLKIV